MASEHSPVRVQLVDDDVPEVLEQGRPLRVVRKDSGVEHVRIRENQVRAGRTARRASWGVSPS